MPLIVMVPMVTLPEVIVLIITMGTLICLCLFIGLLYDIDDSLVFIAVNISMITALKDFSKLENGIFDNESFSAYLTQ